ncbi:hypothetical protein HN51_054422 [Arachis hypogaea]|uniref:Uncharacterized protein n=1 Tax=Arachis hypogaea TaxID=3818 RepID=A0A444XHU8_ARAHY|nr:uncharacterized protein DS421_19g648690 [Arachis hypogaea]RYQ89295.1 hypothetical protein Ahy_B09g096012 [Arachis hypogaea]
MASTPEKKRSSFPPKRGQIKAEIFNGLASSVVSTVSRVGESLRNMIGNGGTSPSSSSTSTPPPSAYNSEGNNDDVS